VAATRAKVLIVGVPGRMQESLQTLLKAIPAVEVTKAERGCWPLTGMGADQPDLVLLDFCEPATEMLRDLAWIKAHWPLATCLVLADTARQLQVAKAASADEVLLRGFAISEFFATLQNLLKDKAGSAFEPDVLSGLANGSLPDSSGSAGARALLTHSVIF
jgi:DNA-binding NarL/FixJ family response regulator